MCASAESRRCFLLAAGVRSFEAAGRLRTALAAERGLLRFFKRATVRCVCLRPVRANKSGPALREADGCGSVRTGLPASAAVAVSSRARATETAAARRCISNFWRRGAPEQLLPYRVRRYWISDQAGSVYTSVNQLTGVRTEPPGLGSAKLGRRVRVCRGEGLLNPWCFSKSHWFQQEDGCVSFS